MINQVYLQKLLRLIAKGIIGVDDILDEDYKAYIINEVTEN